MSGATAAPLLVAGDSHKLNLSPLDGLRALCCMLIVCGHLFMYGVPQGSSGPYPIVGLEFLSAVSLFMVLSGFTLVVVYARSQRTKAPVEGQGRPTAPFAAPGSLRVFLSRRVARLAPIYYLSLLVALPWLLLYSTGTNIAISVPLTLLMLQSLVPSSLGGYWNGPLWQISALMLCYLSFPRLLARLQVLTQPQLRRLLSATERAQRG